MSSGTTVLTVAAPPPLPNLPVVAESRQNKKRKKRSLWRAWKQLSRCQRNILYTLFLLVGLLVLYYIYVVNPGVAGGGRGRVNPVIAAGLEKARNKAERAHEVINPPPLAIGAGNVDVDEDDADAGDIENNAGEEIEKVVAAVDGEEEDGDYVGDDDDGGQAKEDEDDEDPSAKLPPLDGSVVFRGPQNERQRGVVAAFKHAWNNYRRYAWGHDHLKPITKRHQNWFGLGLTLIDSLDTMYIMGLTDEFEEAKEWVGESLDFSINKDVNLFETTIRVLGGLLSAFHLSGDKLFLEKAKDLGNRLMGAFNSRSGIPYSDVNLKNARGHAPKWSTDSSTSEVATIQLEMRDLSRSTGDQKYEEVSERVTSHIHSLPKPDGLVPIFINADTGQFRQQSAITMGARGDSYYEYLIKQWIQTGKTVDYLKSDFVESVGGVQQRLCKRTVPNNLLFIGELLSGRNQFKPKMDELACFLPGSVALAVHHGALPKSELAWAEEVAYTCYMTFARQPTFLAAEITYFNTEPGSTTDFYVKPNDSHYLLRPETIESLWYLYYVTGNKTYQDWGWKIFQGIEKYTKVAGGYTTIGNVRNALDTRPRDMMESFFLGETLKYLYLLFADRQEIDLGAWVFNTEAHPLPIYPE